MNHPTISGSVHFLSVGVNPLHPNARIKFASSGLAQRKSSASAAKNKTTIPRDTVRLSRRLSRLVNAAPARSKAGRLVTTPPNAPVQSRVSIQPGAWAREGTTARSIKPTPTPPVIPKSWLRRSCLRCSSVSEAVVGFSDFGLLFNAGTFPE